MRDRLLPWAGEGGKPCFLSTDNPNSYVSRLADNLEAVQLGMAKDLLEYVEETDLDGCSVPVHTAKLLCAALRDVLRIAKSRGDRLPQPEHSDEDDGVAEADAVTDREISR
ncbi:hypothetical protein [Actinacidiphila yeochonensis]|uniref:hypothetical protein n=1 Tax=Actinacidiphila yeochonensis TaxID=89050 RepID=UPI0007C7BD89|nr:hypothetical protein [Actinacidiphila yeochonensis]